MKIILSVILALIFVFNSFSSLSGNEFIKPGNREIAGTVTNQNHKFIVGLRVRVINTFTKKQYRTKTNKSGFYQFTNLPLGTYTIKFEGQKGISSKTIKNIEVGLNGGVMYNLSLEEK